ncbi:MAG: TolC family outer membrane protein [Halocynthiibacter sp.]
MVVTVSRKWIGVALLCLPIMPIPVAAETLHTALISAYKSSGLLKQQRAVLRAADEDAASAVAALRPVLSYAANATRASSGAAGGQYNNSSSVALQAELTLYDFGRTRLAIKSAKESVLLSRDALLAAEQQVLLRAVTAYANLRLAQSTLNLRSNNVRVITKELRAARDRFEVGEVTRTDVSLAEARLASARALHASAQGQQLNAREEFRVAVGRLPNGGLKVPATAKIARSEKKVVEIAVKNHPQISQSRRNTALADLGVARAKAAFNPTLSAKAQFSEDNKRRENKSLSVQLSGPLYAGGALSSAVRKAAANRDAAFAGLHMTTLSVEQNARTAWNQLQVAGASREASNRGIRASRSAFEGVREEAQVGSRTTLDVLNAEQELLNAKVDGASSAANQVIASYKVLETMGLLTATHLNLDVPVYDPTAYYNAVKSAPSQSIQGKKLDRILKSIGQ